MWDLSPQQVGRRTYFWPSKTWFMDQWISKSFLTNFVDLHTPNVENHWSWCRLESEDRAYHTLLSTYTWLSEFQPWVNFTMWTGNFNNRSFSVYHPLFYPPTRYLWNIRTYIRKMWVCQGLLYVLLLALLFDLIFQPLCLLSFWTSCFSTLSFWTSCLSTLMSFDLKPCSFSFKMASSSSSSSSSCFNFEWCKEKIRRA